jgi:hypothetical protein
LNPRCLHPPLHRLALLAAIEYAWDTYPSTNRSSLVLFASHLLLLTGVFFGYPTGISRRRVAFKKELVETAPERRVTATEEDDDDSGTETETETEIEIEIENETENDEEEYRDANDGMGTPTRLEFRVPEEVPEKAFVGETLPLNLGTKVADSNELDMMVLDDSSF